MKRKYDWSSVDWTLTDREIAKKLGCDHRTVGSMRKKEGEPSWYSERSKRWQFIDWHLTDEQIAFSMGVTVQAVRYQRKKRSSEECD